MDGQTTTPKPKGMFLLLSPQRPYTAMHLSYHLAQYVIAVLRGLVNVAL
jgi:hypothetical protein